MIGCTFPTRGAFLGSTGGGLPSGCQGRSSKDEGRSRQPGGICFGTYSVPGMGRKPRRAENTLPRSSLCPESPSPLKKKKVIATKGHMFLVCLGVGGEKIKEKRVFRAEKSCFGWHRPSSVQRQNRKPKHSPGQPPQTGQVTPPAPSPASAFWQCYNPE